MSGITVLVIQVDIEVLGSSGCRSENSDQAGRNRGARDSSSVVHFEFLGDEGSLQLEVLVDAWTNSSQPVLVDPDTLGGGGRSRARRQRPGEPRS